MGVDNLDNTSSDAQLHISGLDGIRACAFLFVLVGHCGISWVPNGFGVTVFFFLSGYLITTLLRREWIRTGTISISRFYIRRAFRILPPLYCGLVFAIVLALTGVTHTEVHWKAIVAIQLFMTNYSDALLKVSVPLGLSVLWSLAVEEHFYLVFPWVYRSMLRASMAKHGQVLFLSGLCVLVFSWRVVLMSVYHVFWNRVYTGTDTRLDSILFGSILAIAANPVIDRLDGVSKRRYVVAAVLGVLVLVASIAMRGEMFRQTARYTIQGMALFPVFVYVIRYSESAITRFLDARILTHIGELSYSLYLVHYTVMFAVKTWIGTNPYLVLSVTFALSYMLAVILRGAVELPANRMRNRILKKSVPRIVLHPAPADL